VIQTKNQQKNPRIVQITSLDRKGRGKGTTNTGGVLAVPYTIPGEEVLAEKHPRKLGTVVDILQPAAQRTQPRCRHFTHCGGCALQHISYDHQLRLKREKVAELFQRHDIPWAINDLPITGSPDYAYRNRMDFVWWYDGRFGLRRAGKWNAMENLEECHLLPQEVMELVLELKRRALSLGLPFRDQKKRVRGLRYFIIRRGVFTSDVMVNIVSDSMDIPPELWADSSAITSVYQLINNNLERDTSDGEPVHLAGYPYYREKILGHEFQIGPTCFFQPNPVVTQEMVRYVRTLLTSSGTRTGLLDLYCGVGVFSILLADLFPKAIGIESHFESIVSARENDGKSAVQFIHSEAERTDTSLWKGLDTLVVDPPRTGLHPDVIQAMLGHPFRDVVYVCCNPVRGVEDLAVLQAKYTIKSVHLFDQFPQTPHVEMIAHLVQH
jgi:23S rRNA (uracil1939-C5)-methyltransferase